MSTRHGHGIAVKPSLLRKALRLIHCLQKERGASCRAASVSSRGGLTITSAMWSARHYTDIALRILQEEEKRDRAASTSTTKETLVRIRQHIDVATARTITNKKEQSTGKDDTETVHDILMEFNALIAGVIHAYILAHTETRKLRKKRSFSEGPVLTGGMRRITSEPFFSSLLRDNENDEKATDFTTNRPHDKQPNRGFVRFDRQVRTLDKAPFLLNLLACAVRLKESTGLERALLSIMLSMGHVHQKLLNDLVLEVENQFNLVEELNRQPLVLGETSTLLQLIRDGVVMAPSMQSLQQQILQKFDLQGAKDLPQADHVWNLITVYMDKLYSLELLLIEELECSLEEEAAARRQLRVSPSASPRMVNRKGANSNGVPPPPVLQETIEDVDTSSVDEASALRILNQVFPMPSATTFAPTLEATEQHLQEMPADQVKSCVLDWITINVIPSGAFMEDPVRRAASAPLPPVDSGSECSDGSLQPPKQVLPEVPAPSEWDINLYEIQFQKRIGRGSAGTTYRARWSGQEVAIKVAAITQMGLEGWKTEVASLQRLHHPNVIRLLGSVYHPSPLTYCLVLEYCNAGDLATALMGPTTSNFVLQVAGDMAHGLAYLHSRSLIHRDIKPENVLLHGTVPNNKFTAKISDFGLSTSAEQGKNNTAETGTYRWMAPEIIRHHEYSEKADVYSFALVFWQLLCHQDPFSGASPIEAAGKVALEMARPDFPEGTPPVIQQLIQDCWEEDPNDRIDMEEVSRTLLHLKLTDEERKWLQAPMGHAVYYEQEPILEAPVAVKPNELVEAKKKKKQATLATHQAKNVEGGKMRPSIRRIFSKKSSASEA